LKIRKVISVFLLLVLSVQLLPLKQTIAWLLGNTMTEELVHTHQDGKDGCRHGNDLHKHFLPVYSPTLFSAMNRLRFTLSVPGHMEDLPGRHADDIPTPPPNC
jgi:hypothetical protein